MLSLSFPSVDAGLPYTRRLRVDQLGRPNGNLGQGGVNAACAGRRTLRRLADGTSTYRVRAACDGRQMDTA